MSKPRTLISAFGACAVLVLAAWITGNAVNTPVTAQAKPGNFITGEGLPNPAPNITKNWGELPAGRKWGTSAGIDIDPKDGNVWAYERCGAGTAGGGPVDCDNNPVDPVFKFDRRSGKVLANIGKGVMVTPHGIGLDRDGNVWIADFAGNKAGTKGHQVHKFSPTGKLLMSLGQAGKPGNADGQFNQPNDVVIGPDGSIYVSDGHNGQGMTTDRGARRGHQARRHGAHQQVLARRQVHQVVGSARRASRRIPHAARDGVRWPGTSLGGGSRQPPARDLRSGRQVPRVALHLRPHQRHLHQGQHGVRDRLGVGPAEPRELAQRRADRSASTRIASPGSSDRFEREDRVYQGTAGEGVAVDADGNVYAAEGPNSLTQAGGAFTKYSVK